MAIVSLADAKTYLGVSGTDDDTLITSLVAAAQDAMEKECGRHIESVTRTEYINGTGKRSLWLAEPAESITSIYVDSDHEWDTDTLVNSADYMLDGCRVEYLNHIWTIGRLNVRVIYKAGFTTVPDDLILACKAQVGAMYSHYKRVKQGHDVLDSVRVGPWAQNYITSEGLTPFTKAICARYRAERL